MRMHSAMSLVLATMVAFATQSSIAAEKAKTSAAKLNRDSRAALKKLHARVPLAKTLAPKAYAILVFPEVTKAGLMIGGQYGEGALFRKGKTIGYYSTAGASYGLQAGVQQFGYAMFFMNSKALKALNSSDGFEIGVGPSVVVVDEGMAKQTTTKTLDDDVYAFVFAQSGLMAGLGLQGNKISKVVP